MNIDKILKTEGIDLLTKLNKEKTANVASRITNKICKAFPEHNINKSNLYNELSNINMYFADFTNDAIGAKYYYKNKSIYFNRKYNLKKISELSIHECLHFIQEKTAPNGKLIRYGLYSVNKIKPTGLSLNEAAVQTMSSVVNKTKPDFVKYYGLELNTPSPDYYPIECALLNQITYFIGTYPVFHSTLYSDDIFKTTFIEKTNKKTFNKMESNFDLLGELEDKLSKLIYSLSIESNDNAAKSLKQNIEKTKQHIINITLQTQELIIKQCFETEIKHAKNNTALNLIKSRLIDFKSYLINFENYNFYEEFSCTTLAKIEQKEKILEEHGIQVYESDNQYLPILATTQYNVSFFKKLYFKSQKLLYYTKNLYEKKANNY